VNRTINKVLILEEETALKEEWGISTKAVHGTYRADETGAKTIPLHQTASYDLFTAKRAASLFDLTEAGNIYTRINNPTNTYFEEKMNLLEGGVGALATASGQAAVMIAILNICQAGDHIVTASNLYGGTYTLFKYTFKRMGIEVSFVDPALSYDELQKQIRPNTKLVFGETIGNPDLAVLDFAKFSQLAHTNGVPLMIDNTFTTPYLFRPFEHGADIIIHSATKYIGGHGNSIGGIIIDGGNFDWRNGKFPLLSEPDPSYHGINYIRNFGKQGYITKARVQLMRDVGGVISPFNAFLLHMGLETLALRMQRHSSNALSLCQYLLTHPAVDSVSYPLLPEHPSYKLAQEYFPQGAGGMLTFRIKGGRLAGEKFINNVKLASLVANLGDTRTLVIHPASTTHSQLTEAEQDASGVYADLIRVSVGIEDIKDIVVDFEQALAQTLR
jgi:O-acetylhomoserine (thiol)-lyase